MEATWHAIEELALHDPYLHAAVIGLCERGKVLSDAERDAVQFGSGYLAVLYYPARHFLYRKLDPDSVVIQKRQP